MFDYPPGARSMTWRCRSKEATPALSPTVVSYPTSYIVMLITPISQKLVMLMIEETCLLGEATMRSPLENDHPREKSFVSDIFISDHRTGAALLEIILCICDLRISNFVLANALRHHPYEVLKID